MSSARAFPALDAAGPEASGTTASAADSSAVAVAVSINSTANTTAPLNSATDSAEDSAAGDGVAASQFVAGDGLPEKATAYHLMDGGAAFFATDKSVEHLEPPKTFRDLTMTQVLRQLLLNPVLAIAPVFLLFAVIPITISDSDLDAPSFPVRELLDRHGWFILFFNPVAAMMGWAWVPTLLCEYMATPSHIFDWPLYVIGFCAVALAGLARTAELGFAPYGNLFTIAVLFVATAPRMYQRLPADVKSDAKAMHRFWTFWVVFGVGCGIIGLCSTYMMLFEYAHDSMYGQLAMSLAFRVLQKLARVLITVLYRRETAMIIIVAGLWAEMCVNVYIYIAYPAVNKWVSMIALLLIQSALNLLQYFFVSDTGYAFRLWVTPVFPYAFPESVGTAESARAKHYRTELSQRHFQSLWIQVLGCVFFLIITIALRFGVSSTANPLCVENVTATQFANAVGFILVTAAVVSCDAAAWGFWVAKRYGIDAVRTLLWELSMRPYSVITTYPVVVVLPLMILFKPYNVSPASCG